MGKCMYFKVMSLAEFSSTHITLVWFLSGVCPQVSVHRRLLSKHSTTNCAAEPAAPLLHLLHCYYWKGSWCCIHELSQIVFPLLGGWNHKIMATWVLMSKDDFQTLLVNHYLSLGDRNMYIFCQCKIFLLFLPCIWFLSILFCWYICYGWTIIYF